MTAPNPEIDPALMKLGYAHGNIMDAIGAYGRACGLGDWKAGSHRADVVATLIGTLVRERDELKKALESSGTCREGRELDRLDNAERNRR